MKSWIFLLLHSASVTNTSDAIQQEKRPTEVVTSTAHQPSKKWLPDREAIE